MTIVLIPVSVTVVGKTEWNAVWMRGFNGLFMDNLIA